MSIYTITPEEISANSVKNAPDILEGSPEDNKGVFDKLPELIAARHNNLGNSLVDHEQRTDNPHDVTAKIIGALSADDLKPGSNIVITKNADGSVTITSTGGGGGGGGDMYRSIYDDNSDGIVNAADHATTADEATTSATATTASTATNSTFANISNFSSGGALMFVHQDNRLFIEDGITPGAPPITTGRFRALTAANLSSFLVTASESEKSYAVVNNDESDIELVIGRWYNFILDNSLNTINFSQGGAAQNYNVVGGTSQPTNPKENTIWLNTSDAITDYSIERENGFDGPETGDVWIGSSGEVKLSVDKKRRIEVFLGKAVQYVNNAWKSLEASIFQNNAWIVFSTAILSLLDTQSEYDKWTTEKASGGGTVQGSYDATNKTALCRVIYGNNELTIGRFFYPAVNGAQFNKLHIEYLYPKVIAADLSFRIGSTEGAQDIYVLQPTTGSSSYRTIDVDLTEVTSDVHVTVVFWTNAGTWNEITLRNIYFE